MEKAKRYLLVAVLAIVVFGSQLACDESGSKNGPKGKDWFECRSISCTYKVGFTGDTKTAVIGVRISKVTATPLAGTWKAVN